MKLKHFKVQELVDKNTYEQRGDKAITTLDKELLTFIDNYAEHLKSINSDVKVEVIVNDWSWGGRFQWRGLRTPDYKKFKKFSQHSFGRGIDFDVYIDGVRVAPEVTRQWIADNRFTDWVRHIAFVEEGVNWVHVDTRANDGDLIFWHVDTKQTTVYGR